MANIHIGNVSKKERVLINAMKNPINFGQLFLPKDFRKDTASFYHYEVANLMDNKFNLKPTIFMLPRGHAKTKLTQASILKDITTYEYDDGIVKEPFYVWVAQNKTQSMRNVNFIKQHIETNSRLRYYFGDLKGTGKWTQEELDFKNKASLICRAGIHGIRGLLKDYLRPNRFILDDFEYEGNVKTQHSRDMNSATVTSVILPALDPEIGRLQINQTPVHYDSFIVRIADALNDHLKEGGSPEEFQWIVYKKATSIENPLWPEYFDKKKLYNTKQTLRQAGELNKWYQEYEMEVTSSETSLFGDKVIKYWDGHLVKENGNSFLVIEKLNGKVLNETKKVFVYTFIGCDPASDIETRTSSYTAFVTIAVDYDDNTYLVDEYRSKNMPDIALDGDKDEFGIANNVLKKGQFFNIRRAGVEKHAISSGVFNGIKALKKKHGYYRKIAVTPLSHEGIPKLDRIYNRLINKFSNGQILIKENNSAIEKEIKQFGEYSKTLDLLDALEMAERVAYRPKERVEEKKKPAIDPWEVDKFYNSEQYQNWKTV